MSNKMTTTRAGFRVEDITFRNARRQSEIESELMEEDLVSNGEVIAPISKTPEQVKSFLSSVAETCTDMNTKKTYQLVVKWIDELLDLRKECNTLKERIDVLEHVRNEE